MKQIEIFSDGSSLGNPGFGGYCALLRYRGLDKVVEGGRVDATNNQMELEAVLEALKALKEPCIIDLYSDSRYVCDGINDWLKNWIKKGFKEVKNKEMWQEYVKLSKRHEIRAHWVKGHAGHPENTLCDERARAFAQLLKDNPELGKSDKELF